MNLDFEMHRRTGRTTRMLEQAIAWAREEQASMVFAYNANHVGSLRNLLEVMVPDKDDQEKVRGLITICSFSDITQGNLTRQLGVYNNYDYRTNRFPHLNSRALIDHHALERHLGDVIRYLRVARSIDDHLRWMIDTARMMSVMGRRTYIITDDADSHMILGNEVKGYNVSVEDGTMIGGLNLLNQELIAAHPACVLLIEPKMLKRHFAGALTEMNRWNAQ